MRFIYLMLILLIVVEVILCKWANPFNELIPMKNNNCSVDMPLVKIKFMV